MCQIQLGDLLKAYHPPDLPADQAAELRQMITRRGSDTGLEKLPAYEDD
ncbi:MAG: hypothetical protein WBB64_13210 [Anaerolineales bacterium]